MFDISSIEHSTLVNINFDTTMFQPLKRVRTRGVVDYAIASMYRDVMTDHKNMYSTLTQKPEDNIKAAKFLLYEASENKLSVIADCWIRDVTVIKGLDVDFTLNLDNRQELDLVTKALASVGINDVKYTVRERT